jgi:hypothetical protein
VLIFEITWQEISIGNYIDSLVKNGEDEPGFSENEHSLLGSQNRGCTRICRGKHRLFLFPTLWNARGILAKVGLVVLFSAPYTLR